MNQNAAASSVYRKVGIASLIMMASVFLSRAVGLVREMVIAYVGGASAAVDAYQVAFVLPEILNHIVASGFLSVTFIPIFSRYLVADRETEGWRVFSVILTGFGGALVALIAIAEYYTPELVNLVAPGLKDPAVKAEAIRMTRIILPAQFFFFTGGMLTAVQFAKERFFIPALAPLIYNLGIIAGGLLLGGQIGMTGVSWGVLAGAVAGNFLLQIWGARKVGMRFFTGVNLAHPELKNYILLTLPLMLGLTMTFSTEFFLKFFGSFLPEGSIAALNYSLRVMLILVAFFGQAVGVASYPFMAKMAVENKMGELNRLLNSTLRYLGLVIPFSVLLMVLRYEVVRILFQRGQFTAADTTLTSDVLVFIMVGAIAFAAQTVVVRGYYAVSNTLFPALFGTIAVILSLPVYYLGMRQMGPEGVALAVSISAIFQVLLLYVLWNRRTANRESIAVYRFYIKMALLSVGIGAVLEAFRRLVLAGVDTTSLLGSMGSAIICGALFFLLFVGAGYLFQIREIPEFLGKITARISRKK